MKILIVEDNYELSETVQNYMEQEGAVCTTAYSKSDAMEALGAFVYDLVVLDIMLPDGSGLDILTHIKKVMHETGVLVVSAKDSLDDKLDGLNLGADDYITKPFHLSELNARLKSIYRRRNFGGKNEIIFNEISINVDTFEVQVLEKSLVLTKKEYELLIYFLANKDRALTKQSIAEHLWGDHVDLYDSFDFIYQHIKNLRRKITAAGSRDYITTIYGVGYRFNTSVS
ncbi:response regulator transcription factor [Flammeovirgaceae bacterium SG7u.111]|nr:response regulator transcription factor [Flammeovirgaceae bacterium SG7u.132]WPO34780.1 response regulator transcription factor [Flammeovirgaceae bacterium SG7u.111]